MQTNVTSATMEKQVELLITLRRQLVGKLHTQPFTIYNNETVKALVRAQPHTLEELAQVKGFPAQGKRIKGFGESVLDIFNRTDSIEAIQIEGTDDKVEVKTKLKTSNAFGV